MKLKALSRNIAIGSIFLFVQCQSEEVAAPKQLNTSEISVHKIPQKEIPSSVLVLLNRIQSSKKKVSECKTVLDSVNNFSIHTETGKYLQRGDYHSYTFRINRFLKNNWLENLVLSVKRDGTYKATIVSYSLTSEEKNKIATGKVVDLTGKTAISSLENFNVSAVFNKEIFLDNNGDCWEPIYGNSPATGWSDMIISYNPITCPWRNNGGGGGASNGGSGGNVFGNVPDYGEAYPNATNTGNPNANNPHGGSSGGSNSSGSDYEVITTPVTDYFNLDVFNLTPANESWLADQPFETQLSIFNYLSENDFSSESTETVNEVINNGPISPSPNIKITDINSFLNCINRSQSATITIYCLQPIANNSAANNGSFVGHTFISIKQGPHVKVIGFYPVSNYIAPIVNEAGAGVLGNDTNQQYNTSVSTIVTSAQLTNIISYITSNANSQYNLNSYNCTDFGIAVGNLSGLNLPDGYGTWPGGGGSNPGALGQHIRTMNGNQNLSTSANAPASTNCP